MLKSRGAEQDANSEFIWSSAAPPRVKLFIWLLVHGRTQCRANLHKKGVVDSTTCKVCSQGDETTEHIISACPFSVSFWATIGVDVPPTRPTSELRQTSCPPHIPREHFSMFLALCCWQLWKRRNGVVFRSEALTLQQLLNECKKDANLWRSRLKTTTKPIVDKWCEIFDSAMQAQM
jgi:hypothetical protein